MRIRLGLLAIIVAAALCLAVPSQAQLNTGDNVTVTFTGSTGFGSVFGGNSDPYGGTVYDNTTSYLVSNTGPLIVCDDLHDEISSGESWSAIAYNATTINANLGNVFFGGSSGIGDNGYAAVLNIAQALIGSAYGQTQEDLSAAIWYITSQATSGPAVFTSLTTAQQNIVNNALAPYGAIGSSSSAALTELSNLSYLWVLTPTGGPTGTPGIAQEMIIDTPEGGAAFLYLLLAGLTCFGAMRFSSTSEFGNRTA